MQEESLDSFIKEININLDKIGLRPFSEYELRDIIFPKYLHAINVGINRHGDPTNEDGGLLAIPTDVELITKEQFQNVPVGKKVITCSYGGTNWVTSLVRKTDDIKTEIYKENMIYIPRKQRNIRFQDFILKMAEQIYNILQEEDKDEFQFVGISLGFPHRNVRTEYGIDAYFLRQKLPKSWIVRDFHKLPFPSLIGKLFLEKLLTTYSLPNIKYVYFLNDANSVAQQLPGKDEFGEYPVGFVFGTGSNAALKQWNLEAGKFIMPQELDLDRRIDEKMIELGLVHTQKKFIEHFHGGDYIRYRIASALSILSEDKIISNRIAEWMIQQEDASIVSRLASGDMSYDDFLDFNLVEEETEARRIYVILKECSTRALIQAGQTIGVMIASVLKSAEYNTGDIAVPVEGAVYWKGYGIQEQSQKVINLLIPENNISMIKASSVVGLAQFLMVQESYVK
ncbi:hypothetical protein GF362_00965 [Candidatus Dojkabacteria bacterium]|nr:hypothetical protein [Candidatus Dojkabacteria bacterium]